MVFTEWSLVFFTVFAQVAIGMLLVSEIARKSSATAEKALSRQLPVVTLLTGLSLVLSMTHLGTPLHSVYTILNAGNSWLSREILIMSGFFVSVAALTFARRKSPDADHTALSAVAMLLGLCAVFVMSRVYMLETIPVWDTAATMLGFYGTTLIAGSISGGFILATEDAAVSKLDNETHGAIIRVFLLAAAAGLGLLFIGIPLDIVALNAVNNFGVSGIDLLTSEGSSLLVVRAGLTFLGAALFAWFTFKSVSTGACTSIGASLSALCLVFVGEIVGRLVFYGTYIRIGL